MSAFCDRCNRESCYLLALLADIGQVIMPEHVEARMHEMFRTSGT
jgi:hypothetical protein